MEQNHDALSAALERIYFLEWRLEQLGSVLEDERHAARKARAQAAEQAARCADSARQIAKLEETIAQMHQAQTERDAQTQSAEDPKQAQSANEFARLCLELVQDRERIALKDRELGYARDRLAVLESGRERFFARLIEWQRATRPEDVDLAEFIAELRSEIMTLLTREQELQARLEPSQTPPVAAQLTFKEAQDYLEDPQGKALIDELQSESPQVRRLAAKRLVEHAPDRAAPALVVAAEKAQAPQERANLIGLLGKTDTPVGRASIAQARDSEDPQLRAAALEASLHTAENEAAMLQIAELGLSDEAPAVRRRVLVALASMPKFDALQLLLPRLEDPDPQTRRAACAALCGDQRRASIRALAGVLLDADISVRRAAVNALCRTLGEDLRGAAERSEGERRRLRQRLTLNSLGVERLKPKGRPNSQVPINPPPTRPVSAWSK